MAESSTNSTEFAKKAAACDIVRFTFTDINGLPRTKVVPGPQTSYFIQHGVTSWAGVIAIGTQSLVFTKEVQAINEGNATAIPDPQTFHEVIWSSEEDLKIGEVLCETRWLQDGSPQAASPRYVARKQLESLEELGYKLQSTFELEFSLLDSQTLLPSYSDLDFMSKSTIMRYEKLFSDLSKSVVAGAGIHLETIQTEYSQGQIEITLRRAEGIKGADNAFIMKQAIKEACMKKNLLATFMTRPYSKKELMSSNGTHYNHSLWTSDGRNAFFDPNGEHRLSETARQWIGGLMKHAGALTALCSPTVNCYRRLHSPWAADKEDWGLDDRFTSFRVKNYSKEATYVENRIPSGSCNPYVVLAATVAAGVDGIKTKVACPPPGRAHGKDLPFTLGEALDALRDDHVICEALGQQFVDWFIQMKNDSEIAELEQDLSKEELDKEREFYLKL